jgi:hypothetical protein
LSPRSRRSLLFAFRPDPATWLGAAVAVLTAITLAVLALRRWPRRYEVTAGYHGEQVVIFRTLDEQTFGRVCRALIRAREAAF